MALRPFLTAGVAFATAGVVAATVAIAPPMSPGDVQVAKNTEVALNADLRDLINTYFGQFPGDPGNPGTIHAFGVLQQLLQNATVNDPRATEVIDSYFEEGLSDVIRLLLTRDNPSPQSVELIDAYFNDGLADATRVYLDQFATPEQQEWIDTYFGDPDHVNDDGSTNVSQNGASGIAWKVLSGLGLGGELRANLDTFFNAQTGENPQAVPITTPVFQESPPGSGTIVPVIDPATGEQATSTFEPVLDADGNPTFDAAGNQIFSTEVIGWTGNSNPARRGTFGVIYNVIASTGISGDAKTVLDAYWDGGISEVVKVVLIALSPDPVADQLIGDYFDGGIDKVAQTILVGLSPDQRSKDLWNEFFDNGITGVVRYLLTGPLPEEEGPPVPPETTMLRVANTEEVSEEGATVGDVTTLTKKVATAFGRKPVIAEVSAAPVVDPEPATAPVVDPEPAATPVVDPEPATPPVVVPAPAPVTAPAPAPEATPAVVEEKSEEEATTNVKTGNKVEPVIILPGGAAAQNGKRGGGAWGWNGLADRVNGFVKGVQGATGGGAPAAADPGAGGGTEGGK
ncbi:MULTISPECIES: hypothetical protein [unclassified Mycolicibacterium]|uniref:hypothetical protein n=1 Tax=unclassified Mycolicibacterium TaxID=2636767 RepID=UPI001F4C2412|nr:hypothetical protein [Mycolicibacterium sp. YH-1]UNB53902.1 hypothetical protein L0M16_06015 [Mycolicibacterium sp. YH-1]